MVDVLPSICHSEHSFVPAKDIITPAGEAMEEVMVIYSKRDGYLPTNGDICTRCFQILGQEDGVRDSKLVFVHKLLNDVQFPPTIQIRESKPYISPYEGKYAS